MAHKPIKIKNIESSFSHKTCFDDFEVQIHYGDRIAIIGRNGTGKTTFLKSLCKILAGNIVFGYVPQVIEDFDQLSGGQRFNRMLTKALCTNPDVLMLDEPTNHLDSKNRYSLMRMLASYGGTLIIVSHDTELLNKCVNTLWHIDKGKISIHSGHYSDYAQEIHKKRAHIEQELSFMKRQKKDMHQGLMRQQQRIAKSKASGQKKIENRRWLKSTGDLKAMSAEIAQGKNLKNIDQKRNELVQQLSDLRLPEIVIPKFSLSAADIGDHNILSISDGKIGYSADQIIIKDINFSLNSRERIAIVGDNGCGKTTFIRAILDDTSIVKYGDWHIPKIQDIGYLDQHYSTLLPQKTVFESIYEIASHIKSADIRCHLNDFLFRKNEDINKLVKQLSGGEKALLSLAQIAIKTSTLLILDEITNNIDLETQDHVVNVLSGYPGAMIVVSHDQSFLDRIGIQWYYKI